MFNLTWAGTSATVIGAVIASIGVGIGVEFGKDVYSHIKQHYHKIKHLEFPMLIINLKMHTITCKNCGENLEKCSNCGANITEGVGTWVKNK